MKATLFRRVSIFYVYMTHMHFRTVILTVDNRYPTTFKRDRYLYLQKWNFWTKKIFIFCEESLSCSQLRPKTLCLESALKIDSNRFAYYKNMYSLVSFGSEQSSDILVSAGPEEQVDSTFNETGYVRL